MASRILIVDDEPDIVKIIKILLDIEPGLYEVETSSDGREALSKVVSFRPDVIVLDDMLPLVRGNEVARILKSDPALKHIPIIMVTARHLQKDKIESLVNCGVDEYVTKPFEPEELLARIKAMLRISGLTDELNRANTKLNEMYRGAAETADIRKQMLDNLKGFPLAVIRTDVNMKIIEANANIFDVLSIREDKLYGKTAAEIFKAEIKPRNSPYNVMFFNKLKGKLYLNIQCFAGEGYDGNIIIVTDNTRERMLNNIQSIFRTTMKDESNNGDFFRSLLSEIKGYFFAEAGAVYIFDGDNTYKGEMGENESREGFAEKSLGIKIGQIKKSMHSRIMYVSGEDIKKYMDDPCGRVLNMIVMPLKGFEKKIGVLLLYNCPEAEKSFEYKIEIISFVVNIVSVIYENMMLIGRLNKENILVRSLVNISQIINSTLEYNKLITVFVEIASRFIGTDTVGLFLFNKVSHNLELIQSMGYGPEATGKYRKNFITKEEIESYGKDSVEAVKKNPKFSLFYLPGETHVFALKMRYKLIGYVVVNKLEPDPMHMEMFALLMEHVAKAIENSYLFDQIIRQNEQLINTTDTLKSTEQKLIISEQLAGMGRFAAAVAHEIRNPLTIMLGAVQNSKDATPEEKNDILEHLGTKIIEIDNILKQMMEFAKQTKITIEEFDPVTSIEDTLKFIGYKIKTEKITVKKEVNINSKVKADRVWLERVLLNLYMNALDEMKGGGTLTLSAGEDANNIILRIGDTGKGIPKEIKDKIFEPFNTSKKTGTGLGLYNVKKVIELQGGRIDFITGDTGTVFTIQLPRAGTGK